MAAARRRARAVPGFRTRPLRRAPSGSHSFHGAADTVTGSRHLLEVNGRKLLVDCGLFQGPRAIRDTQPRYVLFGHVHQPLVRRTRIGRTECVNVGHFRGRGTPHVVEW